MDQADIGIASLAEELEGDMNALSSLRSTMQLGGGSRPLIIRKDANLTFTRNVDEFDYDPHPRYVSIGPYNWSRCDSSSLARKADKIGCLVAVLSESSARSVRERLEDILCKLERLEGRARSSYGDDFKYMTKPEFVRMLLLDGCYILARFGRVHTTPPVAAAGGGTDRLEHVAVVRDVIYLVENQIPFFVIDTILSTTGENASAASKIAPYVRELLKVHRYVAATPEVALTKPGHLLHLLHLHLKPKDTGGTSATDPSVGRWRTATEYDFAGVKLKKRAFSTEGARCILDVTPDRRGGTLHVPCLYIDRETWRILRNLTALEQHNPVLVGSYVTAYCVFMSQVACNAQDVELLSKEGIIVHQMGNHGEVADHFANLCKGVVFDANDHTYNYLRETCQALEKRFRSRRGRWMAWLRRNYFSNPWLVVGLVGAAIGLACAVVQAVYSVLSYNKGPN